MSRRAALDLPVYLDNAATTPVDRRVFERMAPYFMQFYGNAASRSHKRGLMARDAVERARREAAALIGASSKEIVWTSGSTESNNLAIKGVAHACARRPAGSSGRGHLITAAHEHKAVLDPCKCLEREGFDVTVIRPGANGIVTADLVRQAIRDDTILASIMWANNEIGTINDVPSIGALCREHGITFHTDGTQWVGKMPTSVVDANIDLLSWSGHKMYGPKGVGALYVRRCEPCLSVDALIDGGGHERGMRSGTLNVPGIVGFGAACAVAATEMTGECARLAALRDRLERSIIEGVGGVTVAGSTRHRLPHISNLIFERAETDAILMALGDVACSAGSACTSSRREPSHVLRALGLPDVLANAAIRLSVGRMTTDAEVDFAIERILEAVRGAREIYRMLYGERKD